MDCQALCTLCRLCKSSCFRGSVRCADVRSDPWLLNTCSLLKFRFVGPVFLAIRGAGMVVYGSGVRRRSVRYRLRTLMALMAVGPLILAGVTWIGRSARQ